jgi:hypothetical protein
MSIEEGKRYVNWQNRECRTVKKVEQQKDGRVIVTLDDHSRYNQETFLVQFELLGEKGKA